MTVTDFCDDRINYRNIDKVASIEPQLFTEEEHTTGAFGAAYYDPPEFKFSWFQTIGVEAGALRNVSVERSDAFPDTDGVLDQSASSYAVGVG